MHLLIMGPPGAGKGTQARLIQDTFKIPHISTGEMFRTAINEKTELGLLAQEVIGRGELAPDYLTIQLVRERLSSNDCKEGFLLDGFPRNINQAKALDVILDDLDISLDKVINIVADEEVLIYRIVGRRTCENCQAVYHIDTLKPQVDGVCDVCGGALIQRKDDQYETVLNRFTVYNEMTKPIIDYYEQKGLILNVEGNDNIENIFKNIKTYLEGLNDNN